MDFPATCPPNIGMSLLFYLAVAIFGRCLVPWDCSFSWVRWVIAVIARRNIWWLVEIWDSRISPPSSCELGGRSIHDLIMSCRTLIGTYRLYLEPAWRYLGPQLTKAHWVITSCVFHQGTSGGKLHQRCFSHLRVKLQPSQALIPW